MEERSTNHVVVHCDILLKDTECSSNIVNFVIFLYSASSAAVLVFYLPGVCTHTDTVGKQRMARVGNILKIFQKNTIFNEHPVFLSIAQFVCTIDYFWCRPKGRRGRAATKF